MSAFSVPTCRTTTTGVRIDVRAMPRSPKDAVAGVRDGRLVVRVTAAPVDGAANASVVAVLARALRVPRRDVRVVSGETGRNKVAEVSGVSEASVREKLSAILS